MHSVDVDAFLANYEIKKAKDVKVKVGGWPRKRLHAEAFEDILFDRAERLVANSRICRYCERVSPTADVLDVLVKPRKMVVVLKDFEEGTLLIAPDSMKVLSHETNKLSTFTGDKRAKVSKTVGNEDASPGWEFYLCPLTTEEKPGAFWFVESTDDHEKVNMEQGVGIWDTLLKCPGLVVVDVRGHNGATCIG